MMLPKVLRGVEWCREGNEINYFLAILSARRQSIVQVTLLLASTSL